MQDTTDDRAKRDDETVTEWAERLIRADGCDPVHPWAVDPDAVTEDSVIIEFHASAQSVREFPIHEIGDDDQTGGMRAHIGTDGYIEIPFGDDEEIRADLIEHKNERWPGQDVKAYYFDARTLDN